MKRVVKWVGASILGVAIVLVAIPLVRFGPRNVMGILRYDQRQEGTLNVGDKAPDVELVSLDGATPQRLHQWLGDGPVVLIFGSFT